MRQKIVYGELDCLIKEADKIVRIEVVRKNRPYKQINFVCYWVVVTASIKRHASSGEHYGEYIYEIGQAMEYDKEKIKAMSKRAFNYAEAFKIKIRDMGKQYLPGQYTDDNVLGARPSWIIYMDVGNDVICDFCNLEFTDSDEQGGCLVGSYAVCPRCAKQVKKPDEVCPPNISFANWVRQIRKRDS